MTELDFIFNRRSIRKFTEQPITDETVELLLKAAMAAPSAINSKPWSFVVVRDPVKLQAIRAELLFGKMNAPCAIAVCGDLRGLKTQVIERFWQQDCSAATENLLLAATALGLGSVWCGVYPSQTLVKRIQAGLGLPEKVLPLNIVYVGYPGEQKDPRTQYNPQRVCRESFGQPWLGEKP